MRGKKILVVEDTLIWHKLLRQRLEADGYSVYTAVSCAEGLRQYRQI